MNNLLSEDEISQLESAGHLSPIENFRPIVPGVNNSLGTPPTATNKDQYGSGVISGTNFGLQPDLVSTGVPGTVPSYRLMPVAAAGDSLQNSAIHTVVQSVVQENIITPNSSGGSISLETNSIPNTDQDVLNLQNGLNTQISNDTLGDVTISAPNFGASGPSHSSGCVSDPGPTAGTTRFLREDNSFQVPPGTGGAANYQTVQNNAASVPSQPRLNFLSPLVVTNNAGNTSSDVSISVQAVQTASSVAVPGNTVGTSATILTSTSIVLPSTGGPFRIDTRYFLYLNFSGSVTAVAFWVQASSNDSSGASIFAGTQTGNSNASGGGKTSANCAAYSYGTYVAGSSISFTLMGQSNNTNAIVLAFPTVGSGPGSIFQVMALSSV